MFDPDVMKDVSRCGNVESPEKWENISVAQVFGSVRDGFYLEIRRKRRTSNSFSSLSNSSRKEKRQSTCDSSRGSPSILSLNYSFLPFQQALLTLGQQNQKMSPLEWTLPIDSSSLPLTEFSSQPLHSDPFSRARNETSLTLPISSLFIFFFYFSGPYCP